MTTRLRSLAKHLLRKYVPEDLEASFPLFLSYTPEQQRLPPQPAFKAHTVDVMVGLLSAWPRTPMCLLTRHKDTYVKIARLGRDGLGAEPRL